MPIQISVKVTNGKLVRQGLEKLDQEIPKIGQQRIYNTMLRIRRRLATPPRRPWYPLDWDSDRQRRFVLAMLRKRGSLPYRPTGRYEKNWHIVKQKAGYSIENTSSFARYASGSASGEGQSHIHEGRRPLLARVVEEEVRDLPREIDEGISYYGRKLHLIP
jgi:hypothetical protein